jgi:hypothetical protein
VWLLPAAIFIALSPFVFFFFWWDGTGVQKVNGKGFIEEQ